MKEEKPPLVSVIIPTYKDWDRLAVCLNALANQSYARDYFEIIVINNDPLNNVPDNFNIWSNCTIATEKKAGSYSARNTAIGMSKGDILAFTDSDCIPDKDWLTNAVQYFVNRDIDRIGGRVDVFCKNEKAKTLAELYEIIFAFPQKRYVEEEKTSITANLFVRKILFEKVGLFNSDRKSGEDYGWNKRATNQKYNILYADDVLVLHPARRSLKELSNKRRRVFGGKVKDYSTWYRKILGEAVQLLRVFKNVTLKNVKAIFATSKVSGIEKWKVALVEFWLFFVVVHEMLLLIVFGKEARR